MTRRIILFAALFFVALLAGAAFAIWIDYYSSGMSRAFYTEKMQHAIRVFTIPLPTVVILAVCFTIVSTFYARRDQQSEKRSLAFARPTIRWIVARGACFST